MVVFLLLYACLCKKFDPVLTSLPRVFKCGTVVFSLDYYLEPYGKLARLMDRLEPSL